MFYRIELLLVVCGFRSDKFMGVFMKEIIWFPKVSWRRESVSGLNNLCGGNLRIFKTRGVNLLKRFRMKFWSWLNISVNSWQWLMIRTRNYTLILISAYSYWPEGSGRSGGWSNVCSGASRQLEFFAAGNAGLRCVTLPAAVIAAVCLCVVFSRLPHHPVTAWELTEVEPVSRSRHIRTFWFVDLVVAVVLRQLVHVEACHPASPCYCRVPFIEPLCFEDAVTTNYL